jgi:2-enoate reductase
MTTEGKNQFGNILKPIKIGPIELKNRMALAPMNEIMSGVNGEVTEQEIAYYAARAKGGVGLVITGAIMGTRMGSEFVWGRNMHCFHPGHIQGLGMLNEHIHYFGAKSAAQMTVGFGRQGHSYDHDHLAPAPTAGLPYEESFDKILKSPFLEYEVLKNVDTIKSGLYGTMTREMSIDEIHHEQIEYARSCQLAVQAGFDVIEIHAPHGYLEHEFLSPFSNKRTDMYGGEWRNRKRFLVEVAEQVRYACPGVPVGCRISAEEHMEGGLTEEEMIDLAKDLQAAGLDYISLSDGAGYEESGHLITDMDRSKHIPEHGKAFKAALKVPVMVSSQHNPVKIDKNIGDGMYDIQCMGRQLFCDPEFVNKLEAGKAKDIKRCERCNFCMVRCLSFLTPACPLNTMLGREYTSDEYRIGPWKPEEPLFPEGLTRAPMPVIGHRWWWKKEIPMIEKNWRKLQGRTPR